MKKIVFAINCLAAVLVSCGKNEGPAGTTPDKVRILYWNIQNGMWADEANDYENFTAFVNRIKPDICIWCEAATIYKTGTDEYLGTVKNGYQVGTMPDHWVTIAQRYGHKYTFRSYRRNNYPQQITARFPITKKWQSVDSEIQKDSTIVDGSTLFEVDLFGPKLYVSTCHLWLYDWSYAADGNKQLQNISIAENGGDKQRRAELEYMMNHATEDYPDYAERLWIVAGDMNSESHLDFPKEDPAQPRFMAQYYMNTEANMVDALKVFYPDTFVDTHNNGKRIDYVYVSPYTSQRLLDCHVEVNDPFVSNLTASGVDKFMIPSDHRPIVLDIKIK